MSNWTIASGIAESFPGWPNPFNCGIKHMTSWQCGNEVIVDIELIAGCVAQFFWSNFVPTFNELTRKFVSGSYKCGFYAGTKAGSPLDVIWQDESLSRTVGGILGPFATALFYVWAAETAFSALDTWQSLIYAEDAGKVQDHQILIPSGNGDMRFSSSTGSIPFPAALCAEDLIHTGATSFILSPDFLPWGSKMFGVVNAKGSDHINFHGETRVQPGGHLLASVDLEDIRFGQVVPWMMESEWPIAGTGIGHQFWWTQNVISPLFPSEVIADRWIAQQYTTAPETPGVGDPLCFPGLLHPTGPLTP